jgi:hypothetical protein
VCRIRPKTECRSPSATIHKNEQPFEHLAHATPSTPANLSMIVKQSYKPLHAKSTQFNKNTIAVTKGILPLCSTWTILSIVWLRIRFSIQLNYHCLIAFRFPFDTYARLSSHFLRRTIRCSNYHSSQYFFYRSLCIYI